MPKSTTTRARRFGAVRRLPSGRYQAHWTGPDRVRHPAPETFASRDAAEGWLEAVKSSRNDGTYIDDRLGAIKLGRWVELWRPTVVHLAPSSQYLDDWAVRVHILPAFGDWPIADVGHLPVAAWVAAKLAGGLDADTVIKLYRVLMKVLDAAVADGRIRANLARGVKMPAATQPDIWPLSSAEVDRLVEAFDPRWRALVTVGCHTGLRFGELAALTAGDVDLIRRRLTVSKHVVEVDGALHFGKTKTRAGRRVVPLDAAAVEALTPLVGGAAHPADLVFQAARGGYIHLNTWRLRYWRPAVAAAGLDGLDGRAAPTPHDMRHTAITNWLRAGVDPTAIATWAGHRSVKTVLDRYTRWRADDHLDADLARVNAYHAAQPAAPAGTVTAIR